MSRTANVFRNVATGVGGHILQLGIQFCLKTVFIYMLGAEYLGLQGFFTNVLSLLNISELGIGTAIVFSLYREIAEKNIVRIQAYMAFYKQVYHYIGLLIAVLATVIFPILPSFMNGIVWTSEITSIYFLYVTETLLTYWLFSYYAAILEADQKIYIQSLIQLATNLITAIIRIVCLLFFRSFFLFLVVGIAVKILSNLFVRREVLRRYPYLAQENLTALSENEKQKLWVNVRAIALYNGGYRINIVLDTLLTSTYISIVVVGIYGNYILLFHGVSMFITIIISSFTASLGNLYVKEDVAKNEFIFRCLNMLNFGLAGTSFIIFWCVLDSFIRFWIGDIYVFPKEIHRFLILNFLSECLGEAVIAQRNACGLFDLGKYRPLIGGVINATISCMLAPTFGIVGITAGTVISRYLTFWWFDVWLIYRYGFHMSPIHYYGKYWLDFGYILSIAVTIDWMCTSFFGEGSFLLRLIIAASLGLLALWIRYRGTEEYDFVISRVNELAIKILKRNRKGYVN